MDDDLTIPKFLRREKAESVHTNTADVSVQPTVWFSDLPEADRRRLAAPIERKRARRFRIRKAKTMAQTQKVQARIAAMKAKRAAREAAERSRMPLSGRAALEFIRSR